MFQKARHKATGTAEGGVYKSSSTRREKEEVSMESQTDRYPNPGGEGT